MYAGFWKRFAAYLLDVIASIIGLIIFLIVWSLFELFLDFIGLEQQTKESVLGILGFPIILSISWLYYTIFESSKYQATVGKMLVGIIVVDTEYSKISFARANVRYWSRILSSIFCVGYIITGFTSKKQALHDLISQTYVINNNHKLNE